VICCLLFYEREIYEGKLSESKSQRKSKSERRERRGRAGGDGFEKGVVSDRPTDRPAGGLQPYHTYRAVATQHPKALD